MGSGISYLVGWGGPLFLLISALTVQNFAFDTCPDEDMPEEISMASNNFFVLFFFLLLTFVGFYH